MLNIENLKRPEVQDWLELNKDHVLHELAFKKSPFQDISIQELLQQLQGRKIAAKKFKNYDLKGIIFPPKLNLEQTSSQITADYKSILVEGETLIDITGGFGIDDVAFASKFKQIYHIEENQELQKIAVSNFDTLGLKNISSFAKDGISFLSAWNKKIDVVYVDPSRRNQDRNRVFLLEDLSPNILENLFLLQEKAKVILIKLSPLIDLSYVLRVLPKTEEIHVVAVKNEVKEVLVKITQQFSASADIYAVNLDTDHPKFVFNSDEAQTCTSEVGILEKYLYETNASLQKSGGNDLLAHQLGLKKLHVNTQLYTSHKWCENFPGRVFEMGDKIKSPKKELKNKSIMAVHRNFPESLTQLRKKYKFSTDGLEPILFAQNLDQVLIYKMNLKKL